MSTLKHFIILLTLTSLFLGTAYFVNAPSAHAESTSQSLKANELTIGQAQDITLKYIQSKYGNLDNLNDHLELFLESDQPSDITNHSEYAAMRTYASTYLMQQQTVQVNPAFSEVNNNNGNLQNISRNSTVKQVQNLNAKTTENSLKSFVQTSNIATAASSFVYDKYAARDYVFKYADDYNSAYASFASDCTNFASQAVHAGGYAKHDDWYMNKISDNNFAYSRSWSLVYDFFNYWTATRGHSYKVFKGHDGIADYAHIGDIIVLYDQTDTNRTWYHAVIETAESGNEVFYGAHTHNWARRSLNEVSGNTNDFFVIHF
jgi:hypothetical protein